MKGPAPWRRTLRYLKEGTLVLRPEVKIVAFNFTKERSCCEGLRRFIFYELPRLQYKNPDVQMLQYENLLPNPFISIVVSQNSEDHNKIGVTDKSCDYSKLYIDCYKEESKHIQERFRKLVCYDSNTMSTNSDKCFKTDQQMQLNTLAIAELDKMNTANFGDHTKRKCICSHLDQVACTGFKRLPDFMIQRNHWPSNQERLEDARSKISDDDAIRDYWKRLF
ncbi:hypothetical protein GJ496_008470 [Pomphorhynchus laevis]|nr:hypothetical protein GJ496_008470 [Pomphorhynchus laevis]